ncbi:MAG: NUDIX hydrolase [Desulfobacterales bacterium]|nr:MAG: NUDIX hydrolase [Desulfobacterales bacterium]
MPPHRRKTFCPFCGCRLTHRNVEGLRRLFCVSCRRPLYENPVPAVCALADNAAGEILLVRRSAPPKIGLWCLPGGFMELGESPGEAVLRELAEETGLTGEIGTLMDVVSVPNRWYHTALIICYRVRRLAGSPVPGDDADRVAFFPANALPEIAFGSHRSFISVCQEKSDGIARV